MTRRVVVTTCCAGVVIAAVGSLGLASGGCTRGGPRPDLVSDQVLQTTLADVRLADGVPLSLSLSVRWRIEKPEAFARQFTTPERYGELVLKPKTREVALRVANAFPSVAAVFSQDREKLSAELRNSLRVGLSEPGIVVKEVTVSDVVFPQTFTRALEQTALKERELEAIREKNALDVESARAAERTAEAEGQVQLKQAEVEGKLAEIQARTEDKRRASLLAKAETDAQIDERRAKTEAARQKLLAVAEADKMRELAKARLEEQKALRDQEVQKQRELDMLAIEKDKTIAQLCATNPTYASFLINRELASKVQIAVLPTGADTNFLTGLLPAVAGGRPDGKSSR